MINMADQASQTVIVGATPEQCFAVASDFERYPDWAHDVKEATVVSRDAQGRATEVEFRTSALGRSTHYTLSYDYSQAPQTMSWHMVKGDIMRAIDGAYTFSPAPGGGTEVTYTLSIELIVPLPGFVKRRAEVRIVNSVRDLKARVEAA
jgi:ribosome-associated toxin RatA of RatAB toxin-antitoxin module